MGSHESLLPPISLRGLIVGTKDNRLQKNLTQGINMRNSILGLVALMALANPASAQLVISGVVDGPLSGGTPKAIEVYVVSNIADLSIYGLGGANNGGGTDGEEFTFPAVAVNAGDFIYVATEDPQFVAFFGFSPDYTTGAASINGDDAIELSKTVA